MTTEREADSYLFCGPGGWHVVWYRDDDNNSGHGDNAEVCYWYGTRDECLERRLHGPVPTEGWVPVSELGDGGPPYDHATATGMYD